MKLQFLTDGTLVSSSGNLSSLQRFLTDAVYNEWNQFIPLCHDFRVEDTDM